MYKCCVVNFVLQRTQYTYRNQIVGQLAVFNPLSSVVSWSFELEASYAYCMFVGNCVPFDETLSRLQ